jgi:protein TonB
MRYRSIKRFSFSISVFLHAILFAGFIFVGTSSVDKSPDLVEISFGNGQGTGSPGGGNGIDINENVSIPEDKPAENNKDVKGIEQQKSSDNTNDGVTEIIGRKKNTTKSEINPGGSPATIGNGGVGPGGFGIGIDWGGKGNRKIYSYSLPTYPEGVEKEIDIKLSFTILPDGTVGQIRPLTKADTRLEDAAINSLRQWRFEALSPSMKQSEQAAVIVFPYRLR